MKIIFLRGSTAVGKTKIAHILERKLPNSDVIHLDTFNIKTIEGKDKKVFDIEYKKILRKIESLNKKDLDYLVIEGTIWDKDFLDMVTKFIEKNNVTSFWFIIERPQEKIKLDKKRLEKNPQKKLLLLQQKLRELKIANEKIILNDGKINKVTENIIKDVK